MSSWGIGPTCLLLPHNVIFFLQIRRHWQGVNSLEVWASLHFNELPWTQAWILVPSPFFHLPLCFFLFFYHTSYPVGLIFFIHLLPISVSWGAKCSFHGWAFLCTGAVVCLNPFTPVIHIGSFSWHPLPKVAIDLMIWQAEAPSHLAWDACLFLAFVYPLWPVQRYLPNGHFSVMCSAVFFFFYSCCCP